MYVQDLGADDPFGGKIATKDEIAGSKEPADPDAASPGSMFKFVQGGQSFASKVDTEVKRKKVMTGVGIGAGVLALGVVAYLVFRKKGRR